MITETEPESSNLSGRRVAPLVDRLISAVIDTLVFASPTIGLLFLADVELTSLVFGVVVLLMSATYEIVGVARWGKTLGKAAMGIEVVSEGDEGRLTWRQSAVRYVVKTTEPISTVLFVLGSAVAVFGYPIGSVGNMLAQAWVLVVIISVLSHDRRRGFHDRAAGSVVVTRNRTLCQWPLEAFS